LIRSKGITRRNVDGVAEWPDKKLFDLVTGLAAESRELEALNGSPFTFAANDSLSGRPVPFASGDKRLAKATQLARFAALYADALLVRDPFEFYANTQIAMDSHGRQRQIGRGLEPKDFASPSLRRRAVDDVRLAMFYKPLVEAGLIGFAKTAMHWCPSCVRIAEERGELSKLMKEPDELAWQRRVASLVRHIEKAFIERGSALVHQHGGHAHAVTLIPPGLLEYSSAQWNLTLPEAIAKRATDPLKLSLRDARTTRILVSEIDRIIDDISTQNATASTFNCQYITDRAIDLELMDLVSNKSAKSFTRASSLALTHPLAFVDKVPLDRLLKFRKQDGEAFRVYRDSVRQVLARAPGKTEAELREALDDEIRPELNRIDMAIKSSRKLLASSALTDLTVTLASVSIAAFSGLLPHSLGIPDNVVNLGAAVGGWQGVKGLASKAASLRAAPKEVSENKYAFLWKVRSESKLL
jgi:hypothetical protein